jgi:hypothetical protein
MLTPRLLLLGFLGLCVPATYASYTAPSLAGTRKLLLVGDSLSVGPFGREMQTFLCDLAGEGRVYVVASCGSSPEHWLEGEPAFVSKCGSRVKTPSTFKHHEFEKGRPPEPFTTPKIAFLLERIRPATVVVQLGTNWFDLLEAHPGPEEIARLGGILDRFADSVQNAPGRPALVWITPPDSSRFRKVQDSVTKLLLSTGKRRRFTVIDSSSMVRYEAGQSGGDGVHYFGADAVKWADGVKRRLRPLL